MQRLLFYSFLVLLLAHFAWVPFIVRLIDDGNDLILTASELGLEAQQERSMMLECVRTRDARCETFQRAAAICVGR